MLRRIQNMPFSTKLICVYIISMLMVITLTTFEQINHSVTLLESEKISSLDMLTEQVALNFAEHQTAVSNAIYSRLRAFEIPVLMRAYNSSPENGYSGLQYALAQTVSESTEYDCVTIELADGTRLSSGHRIQMSSGEYSSAVNFTISILKTEETKRYGSNRWFRSEDEGVYIMTNVFDTSPLEWVGRAVFHLREGGFSVSEVYENTGFAFFDSDGTYLTFAGMQVNNEQREEILMLLKEPSAAQTDSWGGGDFFTAQSSSGGWTAVGFSSKLLYRQMRGGIVRVGITYGCIGFAVGITLMLLLVHNLVKKLRTLKKSMDQVAEGNLESHIEVTDNDDISQMATTFNYMTNRIKELLDEIVEKERLKKDAELEILEYKYRALETQIRPHFIYNAFEIVNAMAKIKGETEIVEIVQRISRYFRNITINTTRQFITTQQEFDALQDYTEIYRFIHGDRLKVTFSARDAARNAMIPTMIVQPVVENALKHGIREQSENSEIIVHSYINGEMLFITVKDSGYGLTPEQEYKLEHGELVSNPHHGGIGVGNVRQRLELIYGDEASFDIRNRPEGGVVVKIEIPLTYSEPSLRFEDDEWDFK